MHNDHWLYLYFFQGLGALSYPALGTLGSSLTWNAFTLLSGLEMLRVYRCGQPFRKCQTFKSNALGGQCERDNHFTNDGITIE